MNDQNYVQPPPPPTPPPNDPYANPGRGLSIAGLVLGIVGIVFAYLAWLVFPIVIAVVGLILSIIGMKKSKDAGYSSGVAMAGIICSAIGLVLCIICLVACGAVFAEMDGLFDLL